MSKETMRLIPASYFTKPPTPDDWVDEILQDGWQESGHPHTDKVAHQVVAISTGSTRKNWRTIAESGQDSLKVAKKRRPVLAFSQDLNTGDYSVHPHNLEVHGELADIQTLNVDPRDLEKADENEHTWGLVSEVRRANKKPITQAHNPAGEPMSFEVNEDKVKLPDLVYEEFNDAA